MPRVERASRALEMKNGDIGGKQLIHPSLKFRGLQMHFRFNLQVHHLTQGVNSGVGSAGALHFKFSRQYLRRCFA
jgi:hypothetical protein